MNITINDYKRLISKRGTKSNQPKISIVNTLIGYNIDYVAEYRFHPKRRWRFDFAIVEKKIAIEYEGIIAGNSRHTNIKGYTNDCEKYNAAQKLSWKVLRYTALNYKQLYYDLTELGLIKEL